MYIRRLSPNGFRALGTPRRIIIHALAEWIISEDGSALHAAEHLERSGLSAHALILPTGDIMITRYDSQGAYHARAAPNKGSIGLEFLVPGVWDYRGFRGRIRQPGWCTDEALEAGARHVRRILRRRPTVEKILRHSDIDTKKRDPGDGFPWARFCDKVLVTNGYGYLNERLFTS